MEQCQESTSVILLCYMFAICTVAYMYTTTALGYKRHSLAHTDNGDADVEEGAE